MKTILAILFAAVCGLASATDVIIEWNAVESNQVKYYELVYSKTGAGSFNYQRATPPNRSPFLIVGLPDGTYVFDLSAHCEGSLDSVVESRPAMALRRLIISEGTTTVQGARTSDGPWRTLGTSTNNPVHITLWPKLVQLP